MKKLKLFIILFVVFEINICPIVVHAENEIRLDDYSEILLAEDDILSLNNKTEWVSVTEIPNNTTVVSPSTTSLPAPTSTNVPALIVVHRVSNTCIVYDKYGQIVNAFIVSTGRQGHRTPLGNYKIYEHNTGSGYHLMVDGTYGRWCMRFKQGGYMFHSVCYSKSGDAEPIPQEVADLGTSVSRGCVRLSVADAEWLYRATPNGCIVKIVND